MLSVRKLAIVAAAAAIGGSLLGAAGPAAAVEAHSGIQPWMNGSYQGSRAWRGGHHGYAGGYRYDYLGWENRLKGVSGLADTAVGGAVSGVGGGVARTTPLGCNDKATMFMCSKVEHDGSGGSRH